MTKLAIASALFLLGATAAHAQNWAYQSGPNGTPPFAYGDPYGNLYRQQSTATWPPQSSYTGPQSFGSVPDVPGISRYSPGRVR